MSQGQRPTRIELRKAKADYGQDIGSLHILDRLLYLACKPWQDGTYGPRTGQGYLINRTSRYLDGEEEREGIYR